MRPSNRETQPNNLKPTHPATIEQLPSLWRLLLSVSVSLAGLQLLPVFNAKALAQVTLDDQTLIVENSIIENISQPRLKPERYGNGLLLEEVNFQPDKKIRTNSQLTQELGLKQIETDDVLFQIDGALTDNDNTLSNNSRYDTYVFQGQAGQIIKVILESEEFDTYLILENQLGERIAENDYGRNAINSEIVIQLPSDGQYQILVNSYDATGRGFYRLTMIPATEADQFHYQGIELFRVSQFREALQSWELALELYGDLGNRIGEAENLNNIGTVYHQLGNHHLALDYYEQSLYIIRDRYESESSSASLRVIEANILRNIGNAYQLLGDYSAALDYYEQSLLISRDIDDRTGESATLNNTGNVYKLLGDYPAALDYYEQSLLISRDISYRVVTAKTLNNIGVIYQLLGDYPASLDYYEQGLLFSLNIGNRLLEAINLGNIGTIYDLLGDYLEALDYYKQSLDISRDIGDRAGEAYTSGNIGNAYRLLGDYPAALDYYKQNLDISRDIGDRTGEALALDNIGIVYEGLENYPLALDSYQQSLFISSEVGYRVGEASSLSNIGNIYRFLEDYPTAIDYYEQSLLITIDIGDRATEAQTLSNIGSLLEAQDQSELAIVFFKQSIDRYEGIRASNRTLENELQTSYTLTVESTYRQLAGLLLQQDRILEARQVLDLLKLQELDDYLQGIHRDGGSEQAVDFRAAEEEIIRLYEEKQNELISLGQELATLSDTNTVPLEDRTDAQRLRIRELRQLESVVREAFNTFLKSDIIQQQVNRLRRTTGAANIELDELNDLRDNLRQLDQNAVAIYPLVLPDRIEIVLVTANAAPIHRTTIVDKAVLNRVIGQFRYALEIPGREIESHAQQLYEWLIRPIEDDLTQAEAETIIYAPDEQLRYIPLATLHDGEQWLAEQYRVQNITSASLDDLNTNPARGNLRVLAAAFTEGRHEILGSIFSGLTHAGPEIDNLAQLIPDTDQRLNQEFHPDIVHEMDDYQIVHLATHATFNPGPPENSYIVFGNGDHANLLAIENWSFPNVELIVLSACETAVGDVLLGDNPEDADGKEILGFGYRMQQAGADSALASLWSVDDGGTQLLMTEFYDALSRGGLTKAEALRQAQLSFINADNRRGFVLANSDNIGSNDLSHPHYWAPFILIGNGL